MTLFSAYEDLYLSLVEWGRKVHGSQGLPEYNALLGLATLATLNLFSAVMLSEAVLGARNLIPISKPGALLIWIGFVALHYLTLLRAPRPRASGPQRGPRRSKMWTVCLYALASVALYAALLSARWEGA